ncbi:MAG TPA: hypothetical protein VIO80_08950, partial [Candidatus Dormibacteraeota bacterium]
PQGGSRTFACRLLTLARRAVPCGSVEITRRVVTRFGLSVTHVRSQIAVPPFYVALPCSCKGVLTFTRAIAVLIWACHAEGRSSVM